MSTSPPARARRPRGDRADGVHGIGANAQERTDLALELLQKVGLPDVSFYKYPHVFQGRQRQRIAINRCLTRSW